MERNTPLTEPNPPRLRQNLTTLIQSFNSFRQSLALDWNSIVEKLESFDNVIESRCSEIEKKESLVDLRLAEVQVKEAELACLEVSLKAKLRDVKRREEECEDTMGRAEAERLNLERRTKVDEGRMEAMKREGETRLEEFDRLKLEENEVENRRKEVELKEVQVKKRLEKKEKELEMKEKEMEMKEMEFLKMMEKFERSKLAASEALILKETELEKQQKGLELKELEFRNKFEEHERLKLIDSEELKRKEIELEKQQKVVESKEMEFKNKMEALERIKLIALESSFGSGDAKRKRNLDTKCPQSKVKTADVGKNHKPEISASFIARKRQKNEVAADLSMAISETEGSHPPQAAKKPDNHGQTSATSSQCGLTKTTGSTVRKVVVEPYDFNSERSPDKFGTYQVWAMFSDKDGLPRTYGRIENIIKTPLDIKLHVALLQSCSPLKDARQPLCWGKFIVKKGESVVVPVAKFSHRQTIELIKKDECKIYPGEGEIWALYRNKTPETSSTDDAGNEYELVKVLGGDDSGARVVFLEPVVVETIGSYFYRVPKRSKRSVTNIAGSEFTRFSHRCCASQQMALKDDRLKGYWEIDPKSIHGTVIRLN